MLHPSILDAEHTCHDQEDPTPSHTNILVHHIASSSMEYLGTPKLIHNIPQHVRHTAANCLYPQTYSQRLIAEVGNHSIVENLDQAALKTFYLPAIPKSSLEDPNSMTDNHSVSINADWKRSTPSFALPHLSVRVFNDEESVAGDPSGVSLEDFQHYSNTEYPHVHEILSGLEAKTLSPEGRMSPSLICDEWDSSDSSNQSKMKYPSEDLYKYSSSMAGNRFQVAASTSKGVNYGVPAHEVLDLRLPVIGSSSLNNQRESECSHSCLIVPKSRHKSRAVSYENELSPDLGVKCTTSRVPVFSSTQNPFLKSPVFKRSVIQNIAAP
jgi:hypothetical protein